MADKDEYQLSEHFHKKEFNQPQQPLGLDEYEMNPILIAKLEELRKAAGGKPVRVTSGYRGPEYNQMVGGAKYSRHMFGDAADIRVEGMTSEELAEIAKAVGFPFILPYKKHLHIDVRGLKANGND